MRWFMTKLAMVVFVLALMLLTGGSQNFISGTANSVAAQLTDDQQKIDIYTRFVNNRIPNPTVAYQAARDYMQRYSKEKDQYIDYIKQWMMFYERDERKSRLPVLINEKNFAEAYKVGNQILTDEPDYLRTQIDLGYAGYLAAGYCGNVVTEAGDTLRKIAQRCGVTPEDAARMNNNIQLDNPLPVGQPIKLPAGAATTFNTEALANARKAIQLL